MNMPIVQKVEIYFWDFVIHMLTQSDFVRSLVKKASRLNLRKEILGSLALIASGGFAGLLIGIILPMIVQVIR